MKHTTNVLPWPPTRHRPLILVPNSSLPVPSEPPRGGAYALAMMMEDNVALVRHPGSMNPPRKHLKSVRMLLLNSSCLQYPQRPEDPTVYFLLLHLSRGVTFLVCHGFSSSPVYVDRAPPFLVCLPYVQISHLNIAH